MAINNVHPALVVDILAAVESHESELGAAATVASIARALRLLASSADRDGNYIRSARYHAAADALKEGEA